MPAKNIINRWKSSLKWKLISIFLVIVMFNLVVIGFFVNRYVAMAIEKDSIQLSRLILKQANLNLERYLGEIEQFMFTLSSSQELLSWASLTGPRKAESVVPYSMIVNDYIQPFARTHPELLSLTLYNTNGNEAHYSPVYGLKLDYSMSEEAWLEQISPAGRTAYRVETSRNYVDVMLRPVSLQVITLVKKFGFDGSTYLKIDIQPTLLESILKEMNPGNNGVGFLVNEEGIIVAHPHKERFLSPLEASMMQEMDKSAGGAFVWDDSNEIAIYENIAGTDWKSVILIPYEDIAKSIYTIRNAVFGITAACLVVSAIFIVMVSSSITRRLSKLKRLIKRTGRGHLHVPAEVEGQDEISALANSYNQMLEDLQEHIKRLAESKVAEQQAVLFSLQSQIDSHFLYNTLEIINSMASQIHATDIEQMTVDLANLFRYTANYKDTKATIRDEVEHLQRYLHIIQTRYGDKFTHDLFVEETCWKAVCPKVILQPLAENAVKHGFETSGGALHLSVAIRKIEDQWIEVCFADNGTGFSEDKIRELNDKLHRQNSHYSDFQRIGLLNIHYRLTTQYTSHKAGLRIRNSDSGGAEVRFCLPMNL
ncbi:sensor histidine kinase [Paenibacillus sp. 32O-W]|uniref:cache domain-containing sensor histidine kinase n=1 Tax=Paenibacillus sp. 32O-W TaxID=1695218 RepID=UPI0011A43F95|nr:sensor histidine kinase [Paenibacillus sp. 32O-W]